MMGYVYPRGYAPCPAVPVSLSFGPGSMNGYHDVESTEQRLGRKANARVKRQSTPLPVRYSIAHGSWHEDKGGD